jgi:hypothetical protein
MRNKRRTTGLFYVELGREATTMTTQTTPSATTAPSHQLIASDRIEGTIVRHPQGGKLGSIERLMIDKVSGTVAYAVMKFGGIFNIGTDHYPIPWSMLKFNLKTDSYELDISEATLAHAPKFDFGDRAQVLKLHNYYQSGGY